MRLRTHPLDAQALRVPLLCTLAKRRSEKLPGPSTFGLGMSVTGEHGAAVVASGANPGPCQKPEERQPNGDSDTESGSLQYCRKRRGSRSQRSGRPNRSRRCQSRRGAWDWEARVIALPTKTQTPDVPEANVVLELEDRRARNCPRLQLRESLHRQKKTRTRTRSPNPRWGPSTIPLPSPIAPKP